MTEPADASRSGVYMALVYLVPCCLWLGGQAWVASAAGADLVRLLQPLLPVLLLVQFCSLALCMPWLLRYRQPVSQLCGLTVLILVPLPLYCLAWVTGVGELVSLVWSLLALPALGICLYIYYRALMALTHEWQGRGLLLSASQVGLCLLVWASRAQWLALLGVHHG